VRDSTDSNVPAQASRLFKKFLRWKIFLSVAGMEECSNWDVASGPDGLWSTAHTGIHVISSVAS
jgi:hypothetical protein